MNILKHMEATFIVAALVAVPASYLGGGIAEADARADQHTTLAYGAAVATSGKMATVVVSARRPDASEKRVMMIAAR